MSSKFLYRVTQVDVDGKPTSGLTTSQPIIALADFLAKARKPTKKVAAKTVATTSTVCEIQQTDRGYKPPEHIQMSLVAYDIESRDIVSRTIIKTMTIDGGRLIPEGFDDFTDSFYFTSAHQSSLKTVASRLYKWCDNDVGAMKILVALAGMNPEHAFWETGSWKEQKRELKY